jgi:hypothetical protein
MSFIINPFVYPSIDPDCAAFLTATGITDSTISGAICTLVTSLKSANLWTKLNAIYPFVGGTATTHSFNLRNTAQYQISWSGGVTHNANGITGNGTNALGNTNYGLSLFSQNNLSYGLYCRTNSVTGGSNGADDSSFVGNVIYLKNTDFNTYFSANNFILNGNANYITDTRGLFIVNRLVSTSKTLSRNGSVIRTDASTSIVASATINFYWLTRNRPGNVPIAYDNRNLAFGFFGVGLTTGEQSTLYTAIQTFQTTLGRQV